MHEFGIQMCCGIRGTLQKNILLLCTMLGLTDFACAQFFCLDTLWLFVSVIRKITNETLRHFLLHHDI